MSVRNERTTIGLFDGDQLRQHWRVSTDERRTADEWGLLISGLIESHAQNEDTEQDDGHTKGEQRTATMHGEADGVVGLCISSTVPVVLHELRSMTLNFFPDAHTVVVGPGVRTGLPVRMDNPREVGTDRVANAVAAAARWGGPVIVVDLGTAIVFEVVNTAGQYVGGVISPGVDISVAALRERGAQLRQVEIEQPRTVVAKNTIEALQSGAVHGFAGLVDGVVARIIDELDEGAPVVVATGALDSAVIEACSTITDREPYLTLYGLQMIYERNTR
jgi:type III pantothenate kinase